MHVTHNLSAYDRMRNYFSCFMMGIRVVPRVAFILRPFFGDGVFLWLNFDHGIQIQNPHMLFPMDKSNSKKLWNVWIDT